MNNVSLTGRLTREPELRYGGQDNSTAITRFTLAVDDGKDTDFINIKCFGRTAEWAQKWLSKGSRAEVTGKIKTGSYAARPYMTVANEKAHEKVVEAQRSIWESETGE